MMRKMADFGGEVHDFDGVRACGMAGFTRPLFDFKLYALLFMVMEVLWRTALFFQSSRALVEVLR